MKPASPLMALSPFGAASLFHCSHRILRSYPVRVLSSVILLAGLALCVILAAVHLPIRLNKQKNVRGEPLTFSPPEGHIGKADRPRPLSRAGACLSSRSHPSFLSHLFGLSSYPQMGLISVFPCHGALNR